MESLNTVQKDSINSGLKNFPLYFDSDEVQDNLSPCIYGKFWYLIPGIKTHKLQLNIQFIFQVFEYKYPTFGSPYPVKCEHERLAVNVNISEEHIRRAGLKEFSTKFIKNVNKNGIEETVR